MKKYVTFKVEEFQEFLERMKDKGSAPMPAEVEDAVVIRRQDVFAPPALDSYANSIVVALEALPDGFDHLRAQLREKADYFHEQAELAWHTNRKLPD